MGREVAEQDVAELGVTKQAGRFDLIETMAFDPMDGLRLLDLHMGRMKHSAAELGFTFNAHSARNELQAATFHLREAKTVRLLLSPRGSVAIEIRDPRSWSQAIVPVAIVPRGVAAGDLRLCHKTTDRAFYRDALARAGTEEVLLCDEQGFVTEGSYTSLFVERGEKLVTPPLSRGLLPGVLRQSLIDMGEAVEGDLRASDLERGFFIGNAARGLVAATLVAPAA